MFGHELPVSEQARALGLELGGRAVRPAGRSMPSRRRLAGDRDTIVHRVQRLEQGLWVLAVQTGADQARPAIPPPIGLVPTAISSQAGRGLGLLSGAGVQVSRASAKATARRTLAAESP